MKGLFLLLLALIFGYGAWEYFLPARVTNRLAIAHPDAASIVLLRETRSSQEAGSSIPGTDLHGEASALAESANGQKRERAANTGIVCYTLGPFRDQSRVSAFSDTIRPLVSSVSVREREQKERSIYWVYLKPVGTRKEAVSTTHKLVENNIKDYYIINSGQKINGISLGHYRESERGFKHTRHLRELGFDAQIEPIYKVYPIYWLDYEIRTSTDIPQNVLDQYLSSDINRLSRECQV